MRTCSGLMDGERAKVAWSEKARMGFGPLLETERSAQRGTIEG